MAFLAAALVAVLSVVARSSYEERTRAAAVTAALVAFLIGAAFDWLWQMPVVPVAVLLLLGAALAPAARDATGVRTAGLPTQVAAVVVGLGLPGRDRVPACDKQRRDKQPGGGQRG